MALTKVTYSMIAESPVNVVDYGADSTGVADSSTAIQAAIDSGKLVYIPSGTYKCNVTINNKTIIYGDGSHISILEPFDTNIAILTYGKNTRTTPAPTRDWTYHSEIKNLGFQSEADDQTGIGFTFGQTDPADYVSGDQLANNVKFYGCYFRGLEKGVQFPFGNIGTEFYSCGWSNCYYGVYMLNNKYGGVMHAGNKYFYAGQFDACECAVYLNNTASGFGAVSFKDTIIEGCKIAGYFYNTAVQYVPISFDGIWLEGNGVDKGVYSVTLDQWSGTTKTTASFTARNFIFDGLRGNYVFKNSRFTDVYIKADDCPIIVENCRVASAACTVDHSSSPLTIINPFFDDGIPNGDQIVIKGSTYNDRHAMTTPGSYKWFFTLPRSSKIANYGTSITPVLEPYTSAVTMSGLVGSVVPAGRIYDTCNEYTTSTALTYRTTFDESVTNGWYVTTFDFQVIAGNPEFCLWNSSSTQLVSACRAPSLNTWYTVGAIGSTDTIATTIYLSVTVPTATTHTWRLSALQLHRFNSLQEAQSFLDSGAYAES